MTRDEILQKLQEKPWFKASGRNVQATLQFLPAIFDGYLADLADRPGENVGNLEVLRINHIFVSNFGAITIFAVKSPEGNEYEYEYFSWNRGPLSGAKGLVRLLNDKGKATHIVIVRGEKFATGKSEYDLAGGFTEGMEGVEGLLKKRFLTELKEELGMNEAPTILAVHDLGRLHVDAGLTNNWPFLFCADVPLSEVPKIGVTNNPDEWELENGPIVVPVEQLSELIDANDDALFLSAVCRLKNRGLLP